MLPGSDSSCLTDVPPLSDGLQGSHYSIIGLLLSSGPDGTSDKITLYTHYHLL